MKRPLRVKVIGKQYRIVYEPRGGALVTEEGEYGECNFDKQLITVLEGQPLESEQDTVLHEILHAVDGAMIDEKDQASETVIRRLATGLLAVIKDNPSLTRYLVTKPHVEIPQT